VPALLELKAAASPSSWSPIKTDSGPEFSAGRISIALIGSSWSYSGRRESSSKLCAICPHFKREDCDCRKPKIGMVREFLSAHAIDKARSYMIGDRDTDMEFAVNLGVQGLRDTLGRRCKRDLAGHRPRIIGQARRARVHRKTKETDIHIDLICRARPSTIATGLGFFDHMLNRSQSMAGSHST